MSAKKTNSMKTKLYDMADKVVGEAELPEGVFGVSWKPALVKQVLLAQLANRRRPWAHAKGRGEVRGGGKKPWRQKGTGRARHGSIRSPLWVGGGKAHGPVKERDYSQKINKKMKRAALVSALSKKFSSGQVKVFDRLEVEQPKTKILAKALGPLVAARKGGKKFDVLMVATPGNAGLFRAARNLVKTKVLHPESLNTYDVLNYKHLFIDQRAVSNIGRQKQD